MSFYAPSPNIAANVPTFEPFGSRKKRPRIGQVRRRLPGGRQYRAAVQAQSFLQASTKAHLWTLEVARAVRGFLLSGQP